MGTKAEKAIFAATLGQSFTLLSGQREPLFSLERELRLLQLRLWILGHDPMTDAYQEAGRLFAAITLNRSFASLLKRKRNIQDAMQAAIAKHSKLVEHTLAEDPFYGFLKTPSIVDWKRYLRDTESDRKALDVFTTVRLQVAEAGANPSRNVALPIYGKTAPQGFGQTKIKNIYKSRTLQGPYLWVANQYNPYLITFRATRNIKHLSEDADRREEFRAFCSKLITVLQKLGMPQSGWIAECTGVQQVDLPNPIPPLPPERVRALQNPNPRRPATETRRAKRQVPRFNRAN